MARTKKTKLFIDAFPLVHEHFSGVGHSLLGMVKALEELQRERDDFEIILFAPQRMLHRLNRWGFQGIEFRGVPMFRRVIMGLQRRNKLPPLDLILGRGVYFFPNFLNWPLARSKSFTLIHDISFEIHPEFVDPPNQVFLSTNVPIAANRSDLVATVSPNAKKEIHEYYKIPDEKIYVLPNGVDRKLFYHRSEEEIARVKAKHGVFGDYMIFVGNIEPRKNILAMIEAYRSLPKEITDKTGLLLVGGGGWQDKEIQAAMNQARYDGYKILRPYKYVEDDELPALYSGAKALVYPPIYEGFGMPPVEAMACGTPVISSDRASLPWVVDDAGILVEPDSKSLAKAIQKVLGDEKLREKMIQAGYKRARYFSWEKSAKVIVDEILPKLKG